VRILWATWHALTVFGWGIAAMLIEAAKGWAGAGAQPEAGIRR
jgi:hypothetical protein